MRVSGSAKKSSRARACSPNASNNDRYSLISRLGYCSAAISSAAIEKALYQISPPTRVIDPRNHDLGRNYYAFWQDTDDAHGVPQALRGDISVTYPGSFQILEDNVGNKAAQKQIALIKVVAPNVACEVLDMAIQLFGGAGVSDDFGLGWMYANARTLRIADGPDEVHVRTVARSVLKPYRQHP